jgi:hypothetical protein
LFDELFPPRKPAQTAGAQPPPGPRQAGLLAGIYEPVRDARTQPTALKLGRRLFVRATTDGSLVVSGAENDTLHPKPDGYWDNGNGNLRAIPRGGEIVLSTGVYAPLASYKRTEFYALLALLAALATAGYLVYEKRKSPKGPFPSDIVLAAASVCVLFLLVSGLVWLFSPAV